MEICALLVPREMRVEHSGGVKSMTDEQLEAGIEAIQRMLEARAGEQAKVIDAVPEPVALPAPSAGRNWAWVDASQTSLDVRAADATPR
jgi:hypothetical protein